MHKSSIAHMRRAVARHVAGLPVGEVADIGSASRRRPWYREIWEAAGWTYTGVDLVAGKNVDVVLQDPFDFPIADDRFDAVISGQMLEHNEMFWLSFLEMNRILRPGGLMVHIVPSRGPEHRAPQDCWRFYRDGMTALARWSGFDVIEATTDFLERDVADYTARGIRPAPVRWRRRRCRTAPGAIRSVSSARRPNCRRRWPRSGCGAWRRGSRRMPQPEWRPGRPTTDRTLADSRAPVWRTRPLYASATPDYPFRKGRTPWN